MLIRTENHSPAVSEVRASLREKEWEGGRPLLIYAAFWVEMWVWECFHFGRWLYSHMLGALNKPQKKRLLEIELKLSFKYWHIWSLWGCFSALSNSLWKSDGDPRQGPESKQKYIIRGYYCISLKLKHGVECGYTGHRLKIGTKTPKSTDKLNI